MYRFLLTSFHLFDFVLLISLQVSEGHRLFQLIMSCISFISSSFKLELSIVSIYRYYTTATVYAYCTCTVHGYMHAYIYPRIYCTLGTVRAYPKCSLILDVK